MRLITLAFIQRRLEVSWKVILNHTRTLGCFEARSDPFGDLDPSKSWAKPATLFRHTTGHCPYTSSIDSNSERVFQGNKASLPHLAAFLALSFLSLNSFRKLHPNS